MSHFTSQSILTINNGVARLSLNRPAVHNAFDDHLIAELTEHLRGLIEPIERQEVRVLVFASEGKSFSAGADLNWMKRMVDYGHEENLADSRKLSDLMHRLDTLPCPTLCRVQGAAFGGAVGLAACCDVVVASSSAKFCLSEVRIGLSPAVISPYVQRAIGTRQMRRYALSAEVIDADTAQALGLVHQVVESDALDEAIKAMTQTLLKGSPQAQRATKELLAEVGQSPDSDATRERTCQTIATLRASDEGQEGLASFFDKRLPVWAVQDDTDHAGERS
ncbi:enoyl-CoA hydratase/isomerase family protein [Vreelandella malpeensis]|uniref:Enoyl-CoA hydratase/isomerase family protein n=1 Tax=Vreelandella malpeensis TaxID=1172368 RepID=A0ABS8DUS5_9GAMM|nr:enoyl-CoA hydratase/isomerase family protein [Halomonas malpeensis]MCB8890072.1 enoyl-CoA hydratase/isomerase family protein [Halomonas malpeensis]